MKFVEEHFQSANKSLTGTLMANLTTMKYDGSRSMHEHLLEMTNVAAKLNTLGMTVNDSFLTRFMLNSLPPKYGPFQINDNNLDEKWDVNKLTARLVQEETRLKSQETNVIHLTGKGARKKRKNKSRQGIKQALLQVSEFSKATFAKRVQKKDICHFCKKPGHYKSDCLKCKARFERKGKPCAFVCFESILTEVPYNTWWIDFGATTHVSNTMQGFLMIQTISPNEHSLFMENWVKVPVEGVGTYSLVLETGYPLDLFQTLYVPSVSHNLVSLSKLDCVGYSFKFGNGCFSLLKNSQFIGSGFSCDGLYKFKLDNLFAEALLTVHYNIGTKRSMIDESSAFLWHKHLRHISKERLERLVKNEILPSLDFTDLGVCVDCIKGKQTKQTKQGATRSLQLLEIVYINICGPFDVPSLSGEKYFITFIDDFSRYGYIYLLHEKSQALNALEVYITKVERQLDRKVKIIRSDRGGEYYEKYNEL